MDRESLKRNFSRVEPSSGSKERISVVRSDAGFLAETILSTCPESREKSLAFTKLEECVMWASAAIARNDVEGC